MSKIDYPFRPVSFTKVKITDNFWTHRIKTNLNETIPHAFKKCEETGRINNFLRAAGAINNDKISIFPFDDSDVYKVIEGAAYSLSLQSDSKLEEYLDDLIEKIAEAQEEDGYLYTTRTIDPTNPHESSGRRRWEKVMAESHELYNIGHLLEAAVVYYETTGKRKLLDVAIKSVELIIKIFGPGKNESAPGHQEIEISLIRLYRKNGEEKYLKLAKFFLDIRGSKEANIYNGYLKLKENLSETSSNSVKFEHNQTHKKVIDQDEAVGHAVRATYMYSSMVDIAALTNDRDYIKAIDSIWDNVVSKKISITGGVGAMPFTSNSLGEAFGPNYYLPNLKVYNETCASIGNFFWNYRLFLLRGDSKYIDVMERILYNGLISGVSLNGTLFFYPNPLASKGRHRRYSWFPVACCPTNIARFIPSISGYIYAQQEKVIYVNLFVSSTAALSIDDKTVLITQKTEYPWKGDIKLTINTQDGGNFTVAIRIPGWAQNVPLPSDLYHYLNKCDESVSLKVNGKPIDINIEKGFVHINRIWKDSDFIELELPMSIRRVLSHEKVKANIGKVALERGPIVYCVEWPDNGKNNVFNMLIDDNDTFRTEFHKNLLNGIVIIKGSIHYLEEKKKVKRNFTAIPYYAWANRGKGKMTVWINRS